jgi:hypothetical protein
VSEHCGDPKRESSSTVYADRSAVELWDKPVGERD